MASATAFDFDLICIGSGPAGQRAAVQATKVGRRVAVVERRQVLGGVCIDTGTIPSKTFRHAVLTLTGPPGTPNPQRPTARKLFDRVEEVVERETAVVGDQLARNRVELFRGVASFQDPHTVRVQTASGTRTITGSRILIATGTTPAPPPGVDVDGNVVMTSDMICGMQTLPRTMTVIGGGVIGIEYASMFAQLGVEVTLIDRREEPLEFIDREIVDELIHQMRGAGVIFRLEEKVESLERTEGDAPRAVVTLASGKRIVSDVVLYSIGRVGATEDLNLDSAGLTSDERGRLTVNEHFQTAVGHIYAAGDVIGYPSLAATSSEQGRRAACHAFDLDARPMADHFPIGIYAIPEISMVGLPEHTLTEQRVPYEVGLARYREIARGQILRDDTGLVKLLFHRETRELLGVHAIGTGATELIHIGQAVLALGGGLEYFINTVFNYPTLAECYKVAAYDAFNKLEVDVDGD